MTGARVRLSVFTPPTGEGSYTPAPFTTVPGPSTLTITIAPRQGVRIAFRLLWESLVAAVRRDTVSFTAGDES